MSNLENVGFINFLSILRLSTSRQVFKRKAIIFPSISLLMVYIIPRGLLAYILIYSIIYIIIFNSLYIFFTISVFNLIV